MAYVCSRGATSALSLQSESRRTPNLNLAPEAPLASACRSPLYRTVTSESESALPLTGIMTRMPTPGPGQPCKGRARPVLRVGQNISRVK
jgi:hypothetical protein